MLAALQPLRVGVDVDQPLVCAQLAREALRRGEARSDGDDDVGGLQQGPRAQVADGQGML
jgi:hypothetical protein